MSMDTATRNLAVMAQMRLDRLARPHDIRPFQAGDEDLVCGRCGFALEHGAHSEAEIVRMRELVAAHDEAAACG